MLELAYYAGLTESELGKWLGQPPDVIRKRMVAGLRRLADA